MKEGKRMEDWIFKLADVYMEETDEQVSFENTNLLLGQILMNRVAGIAYRNLNKMPNRLKNREFTKTLYMVYKLKLEMTNTYLKNLKYLAVILKSYTLVSHTKRFNGAVIST